jgi:ABC-type methionine transport system permease subunit
MKVLFTAAHSAFDLAALFFLMTNMVVRSVAVGFVGGGGLGRRSARAEL